jgi:hypothetical protein
MPSKKTKRLAGPAEAPRPNDLAGTRVKSKNTRADRKKGASLKDAALAYATRGYPVFPCTPDKKPYTKNGFKDATTGQQQINQWWDQWPNASIGMPTGHASGVAVLDLDKKKGKDGFKSVPDWESRSPVIVRTLHGGAHLYFQAASAPRNSTDDIALGVDTRGEGGYVILPPSAGYTWTNGQDFSALPPWPDDLRPRKGAKTGKSGSDPEADPQRVAAAVKVIPNDDILGGMEQTGHGDLARHRR